MALIIHLIFAILGLYFYTTNKRGWFVVLLYMIMTSFMGYLPVGNIGKDIGVMMIVYTIFCTKKYPDYKSDSIKKWIIILLSYYTVRTIFSILLDEEFAFRALKLIRLEYVLIAYFALKRVPLEELYKAVNILLYVTILLCLIQIIQTLIGNVSHIASLKDRTYMTTLMGSIPDTTIFFFAFLLFKNNRNAKDWIFFVIVATSIVLGNVRGLFLAIIVTTTFFLLKRRKIKYLLLGAIIIPIMWTKFQEYSQKEDTITELGVTIEKIRTGNISAIDISEGNFEFRIVLVMERVQYMLQDWLRFLFGIGSIEEQSPNNRLNFFIGSGNIDNEGNYYRQQIETTDVAFITDFLRYGFVYLVIFTCFIIAIYKTALNNKSIFSNVAIFIVTVYLLAAVSNNYFSSIGYLYPIMLAIVIGRKENIAISTIYQASRNERQHTRQQ